LRELSFQKYCFGEIAEDLFRKKPAVACDHNISAGWIGRQLMFWWGQLPDVGFLMDECIINALNALHVDVLTPEIG
jgi:hypothetical protein